MKPEKSGKEESLYYWTSKRSAEIDFILYSEEDGIIPIEVKSGNNVRSVSLNMYINEYNPKYAIRFSTKNFGFENNIKSIQLYAVFCVLPCHLNLCINKNYLNNIKNIVKKNRIW